MRSGTSRAQRFEERRTQLAQSALETLGELGYAKTSLREIAHNSEFTHGVVHYYFADKVELITHCVRLYKAQCVQRYAELCGATALLEPQAAYAMFDGLFEKALLGPLSGDGEAAARLAERVHW